MGTLNRLAAEVLGRFPVMACTDVTGFGLAGHAAEMAAGTACGLRLFYRELPLLPDVLDYAAMGLVPEGTRRNRDGRLRFIRNAQAVPAIALDLLFDPQTSGGLLAALPDAVAPEALAALQAAGVDACIIGASGGPADSMEIVL
jgi:selenide,water dikinase